MAHLNKNYSRVLITLMILLSLLLIIGCANSDDSRDVNINTDTDSDTDSDADSDTDTGSPASEYSYLWVANTAEGTLSKISTRDAEEVARYETCGFDYCDPSRTSVNIYGDMVVTGRRQERLANVPEGTDASMITKFSAYENGCIDRNGNGTIETSTGPNHVLAFEDDECMIWTTSLGDNLGARGTAWDGRGDPSTGKGGNVWVGTCDKTKFITAKTATVFVLNGETGKIEDEITVEGKCLYGAASDGDAIWFLDLYHPTSSDVYSEEHFRLTRVDIDTHKVEYFQTPCAYGITIDNKKRIWTSGYNQNMWGPHCVARFDPETNISKQLPVTIESQSWGEWLRGLGIGILDSAGAAWVAQTDGHVHKIDLETVTLEESFDIESDRFVEGSSHLIGIAIDFDGFIWAISEVENAAYKIDPNDGSFEKLPIGKGPYTYSDMTGIQLQNVTVLE